MRGKEFDLTKESRRYNADLLDSYGRDPFTISSETLIVANEHWRTKEGPISHGYPYTSWLQIGIAYGCGIYTAK